MEIVSLARQAYLTSQFNEDSVTSLWRDYWSGKGNLAMNLVDEKLQPRVCQSGELWEYLIEGEMVLVDGESPVP
ncbi:hypothetical protein GALL_210160 [mine drainage metagenome]|uniref:Uncharacterized protein n=1 Tax=mine drainage metagenome TaxID=410659 RepID=A0A1J5S9L8_9ZZZZ